MSNISQKGRKSISDINKNEDKTDSTGMGGFAAILNKVLSQEVSGSEPILSKRKTELMKEMESEKKLNLKIKIQRLENRSKYERQLQIPDFSSINYEKQLKKLANRGVVTLFNSIAQSKRDTESAVSLKDKINSKIVAEGTIQSSKIPGKQDISSINSQNTWKAFDEKYLLEKNLRLKDWDKDDDTDDDETEDN